jgi:hypothetical protein
VLALEMMDLMDESRAHGRKPVAWRMRDVVVARLQRESRNTGDVQLTDGQLTFCSIPIEIADVRNSLGVELLT